MKTIIVPNGIVSIAESKSQCPHCERHIPFDEIEDKWAKQDKHLMELKCKCKRKIGITMDIIGDFLAFKLINHEN